MSAQFVPQPERNSLREDITPALGCVVFPPVWSDLTSMKKPLQILAKMLVTLPLLLVNGITVANGLITLTLGVLMSITVLLQVIGVNT
jgi:hypothetical protein